MRYLLTPVGSSGDVHPYIGIGRELQARGHEVILFGAEPHRGVASAGGLRFVTTASDDDYHAATRNPDLWHPRKGIQTVLRMIMPPLEHSCRLLQEHYRPGQTMIVGHPLAFTARIFEELTGAPAATIHLAPSSIRSAYRVPALPPGIDISRLPHRLKRLFWWLIDRLAIDPLIAPELNRLRVTHGLPPVRRIFKDWINSSRRVIGLFPDWFGPRQPDWPVTFAYASFPLWDDPAADHIDSGLTAFLDAGSPPVVVTPGSANRHAKSFFAAAAQALTRLGRRGLFLTGYPEQLPAGLPPTILHRRYAPFSLVLPRAALLVSHGGIGTVAQALAAGIPQLVMPMAFDQPDNALRLQDLGVALWLQPKHFTADRVTARLRQLLDTPDRRNAAAAWRDRLGQLDGIRSACDLLEREARA